MTFYNPNIQAAFDADEREFIHLRDMVLAVYDIVYEVSDGCTVADPGDLKAPYQLRFVRFADNILHENLKLVAVDFPDLLAGIVLEVLVGRVSTFEEYLNFRLQITPPKDSNAVLYLGDFIQDYIELLVYSDISLPKLSMGYRDFTAMVGTASAETGFPQYWSLYERLKLYARLRREIKLETDPGFIQIRGREVSVRVVIRV